MRSSRRSTGASGARSRSRCCGTELAANERFLARFRREATTAAGLAHVGIVSVHDIGEDAGRTFIVMEFVAGRTLADISR